MIVEKMHHLRQRLIASSIGLVLLVTAIYLSLTPGFQLIYVGVLALLTSAALWEFYQIAAKKGVQPLIRLGITTTVVYFYAVFLHTQLPIAQVFPFLTIGIGLISAFLFSFNHRQDAINRLAITFFGILYLTIPLSTIIAITYFFPADASQDGRWWVLYFLLVTKATDTGGYFFGKIYGTYKLAPTISPKKTIEGAIGGLIASIAAGVTFYLFIQLFIGSPSFGLTLWQSVWLSATVSLLAQFGDLAESLLKRDAQVKDSNKLPGLGGMLDVCDSLIFTAPFIYLFLKLSYV